MASIRKRNGKYQAQVRRTGFSPISKTFIQLKDAQQWIRQAEIRLDRNELPPDRKLLNTITLRELVVRYREEVVPTKKGKEIETIILNAFLRHPICKKFLSVLNTSDFAAYRDERLEEISPISLKRQLAPLQNMFEIAEKEWGIRLSENPLSGLRLETKDNKRERRLREGELEALLEAGNKPQNPFVIPVVLFALESSLRRGEILSLVWDQIDLKRSSATVLESKNGYSRTIPLSPKACQILHSCSADRCGKRRIFPITPNALRLAWVRLCKRAEIQDLHFHDLRHEAISRFFELGLTVPEVASISGHRDLRMLMRYAHANQEIVQQKLSGSGKGN